MFEHLYQNVPGRVLARLIASPPISRAAGAFLGSRLSRFLIAPFVKKNGIDLSQALGAPYAAFNDFFTRRLVPGARPICEEAGSLASPCDGLLSVYPISEDSILTVKGQPYTVETLLDDPALARKFDGGTCMVFRLTPSHYHRYAFAVSGTILASRHIRGIFHTVRPEALRQLPVFKTNTREYVLCDSPDFGLLVQMEVGATLVGRIVNEKTAGAFTKGEEKGRFEFGGSTIVLLVQKDRLKLTVPADEKDELPVLLGQKTGISLCRN